MKIIIVGRGETGKFKYKVPVEFREKLPKDIGKGLLWISNLIIGLVQLLILILIFYIFFLIWYFQRKKKIKVSKFPFFAKS